MPYSECHFLLVRKSWSTPLGEILSSQTTKTRMKILIDVANRSYGPVYVRKLRELTHYIAITSPIPPVRLRGLIRQFPNQKPIDSTRSTAICTRTYFRTFYQINLRLQAPRNIALFSRMRSVASMAACFEFPLNTGRR